MMGEEFDKWLKLITTEIFMNAWCAGAKAQQKRDVEVAMECARTAPKSIDWDHRIHHSAGCQRVASAIKRQEVEGCKQC